MDEHATTDWTPFVGQRVRAKIEMLDDLTDEGMGLQCCAKKGDELIIRRISSGYRNYIAVSHEHITDRAFCVAADEIEPVGSDSPAEIGRRMNSGSDTDAAPSGKEGAE